MTPALRPLTVQLRNTTSLINPSKFRATLALANRINTIEPNIYNDFIILFKITKNL